MAIGPALIIIIFILVERFNDEQDNQAKRRGGAKYKFWRMLLGLSQRFNVEP